jgi:succinate dehydrogenase/fumarate reductase flavoprotein subunit
MNSAFDIIVVGGGGSGLAAAVSAAESASDRTAPRVLLLEKQSQLGGTTGIAVGSFTANRTRTQEQAGIEDCVEDHSVDAGKFAKPEIEARNNDQLRRFFLSHAADTLHWLMDMGLVFHGPNPEPPNRVSRMHNVVPGAKAYVATLHARLLKLGATILVNADVTQLVKNPNGDVIGLIADVDGTTTEFSARRGVVLAAGDYANSPSTIARFKGEQFSSIEGINPDAHGDGHKLAEDAGAHLVNMDVTYGPELRFVPPIKKTFQQLLPASGFGVRLIGRLMRFVPQFAIRAMIRRLLVTWQHPEDALFDSGAILVNREGNRFCDETVWPDREIAVAAQAHKECFILLDERLIKRFNEWPHFISTAPKIAYAYVKDYLKLRPDVAIEGDDLAALAKQMGLPAQQLLETVAQHNSQDSTTQPLSGTRWALLGPAKAWFTTTEGGAAINKQFQVLDVAGAPIVGLYAVGQTGLGGQILWGHGLHIAWAMTSGRLVGQQLGFQD